MKRAAFPGSFDPPTRAHLWVLEEARKVFDEVTILVASNGSKRSGLLTPEERAAAWRTMTASPVVILNGNRAITEELRSLRICNVVRGLRGPGDVEPELAYRDFMCRENGGIVVSYFMVPPELRSTSSTVVRSIVGLDDWHGLVVPYLQGGVTLTIEKALEARRA